MIYNDCSLKSKFGAEDGQNSIPQTSFQLYEYPWKSDILKIDISYLSSENLMVFLIFIADIIFQVWYRW